MREILFRGKEFYTGEWVEGYYVKGITRQGIVKSFTYHPRYDVILETVGQFTGLYDKNGKRIFEGDIVKHENDIGKVCYSESFAKFRVVYSQLSGNWFDFEGECCYPIALECEVIGNIHDNPELLK